MRDTDQNKKRRSTSDLESSFEKPRPSFLSTKDDGDNLKMDNFNGSFSSLSTLPSTEQLDDTSQSIECSSSNGTELEENDNPPKNVEVVQLFHPSTNLYEQTATNQVVVYLYVKGIQEDKLRVEFKPLKVIVTFSCRDLKLFSQYNATEETCFQWIVNLKGLILPESSHYKVTGSTLELKLTKTNAEKWGSISPVVVKNTFGRSPKPKMGAERLPIPLPPPPPPAQKAFERQTEQANDVGSSSILNFGKLKPLVPAGLTGLDNIGNTCFMNSVLQCLLNTVELRDYFLQGRYANELNKDNPLGTGGLLANAFAILMKLIWSREYRSFAPSKLKSVMSVRATQFSGFAQHDAQEFLVELLDGIHEDLNRIKKKPYTAEPPDLENLPDNEAADESWRLHRLRNDSIVDDLFKGQFKSTLECLSCNKISVKFDEFRSLSVPIPKESKLIKVVFFWKDTSRLPCFYQIALPSTAVANDLERRLQNVTRVPAKYIELILPVSAKNFRRFSSNASLGSVGEDDELMAFEMLSEEEAGDEVIRLIVTQRLMFPNPPQQCSSCGRKTPAGKIRRCTRCYRVGYCNVTCQRANFKEHKHFCQLLPEPVGSPFITSIPKSQATYSNLCSLLESYARFSVNIFQPPVSQNRKNSTDSSNGMSSDSDKMEVDSVDSDDLSDSAIDEDSGSPVLSGTNGSCEDVDKLNDNVTHGSSSEDLSDKHTNMRLFSVRPANKKKPSVPDFDDQENVLLNLSNYQELCMNWLTKSSLSVHCYVQSKDKIEVEVAKVMPAETDFKVDLNACIELFTQPERLSEEDSWRCPRCKRPVAAIKEMNLWRLPKILLVQLKRFSFRHVIFSDKIDKLIEYPVRGLDLKPFMSNKSTNESTIYDLYGVVNHMGRLLGGHYNSFCRTLDPRNTDHPEIDWRICDDSRVQMMSESNVVHDQAYLLLYRRRDSYVEPSTPSDDESSSSQLEGACGYSL